MVWPVYISNLPRDYEDAAHRRLFFDHLALECGCEITPGPVVDIYDGPSFSSRSTILTIAGKNKQAFVDKIKNLEIIGHQECRRISADLKFFGLTPIARHDNPDVDIIFIHGLNGHAFKTWSADPPANDSSATKAWPRDFLPTTLERHGLRASIFTLGYNANTFINPDVTGNLEAYTDNLLSWLSISRHPESVQSQRPMYFVCHSLGGLVLCEALNKILVDDTPDPQLARKYRDLFIRQTPDGQEQCLVRGLMFLGTPFHGSLRANQLSGIVESIAKISPFPTNANPIKQLRQPKSGDLDRISNRTRMLVNRYGMEVCVGCETTPAWGIGHALVTARESALGGFKGIAKTLTINKEHSKMIKYDNENDPDYIQISRTLIQMIEKTCPRSTRPPSSAASSPDPQNFGSPFPALGHVDWMPMELPLRPVVWNPAFVDSYPPPGASPDPNASYGLPIGRTASQPSTNFGSGDGRNVPSRPPLPRRPVSSMSEPVRQVISEDSQYDDSVFRALGRFDTVLIVDDTGSMQARARSYDPYCRESRWHLLKNSISHLVAPVTRWDRDGIDIYFLNNTAEKQTQVTDAQVILSKLDRIDPSPNETGTYLMEPLFEAIEKKMDEYGDFFESRRNRIFAPRPHPLNAIVITDGEADDTYEVQEYIVQVAQRLDDMKAPQNYIGIQFLQIGDDPQGANWLAWLDREMKADPRVRHRDIVDTTPYDSPEHSGLSSELFSKLMQKILMGACNKALDGRSNREFQSIPDRDAHLVELPSLLDA